MKAGVRRVGFIGTAFVLLFAFFLAGSIAEGWEASNLPPSTDGVGFFLERIATTSPSWPLLEAGTGLLVAFGLAVALERILRGRVTRTGLLACTVLVLLATGGGLASWAFLGAIANGSSADWPATDTGTLCDHSIII